MEQITIFTPTYNRGYILPKAYESLLNQKVKNFIWMIIDDGSTDDTEELVKGWIKDNKIKIEYYKKENGGKHTAYNFMLDKLKTKYVLISLDSDDYLTENALNYINEELRKICNENIGIVFLTSNGIDESTNKRVVKYDINKLKGCSLSNAYKNDIFEASCLFLFNSQKLKKYKYPEIDGERFFTEAYTYYQMNDSIIWSDKVICIRNFISDGYTKNTLNLFKKNPSSWFLYNQLRMKYAKKIKLKVKYTVYYISFGLLSKEKNILKKSSNKILTILLFPIGIIGAWYIKLKK